jgi:hypothetical protein
MIEAWQKYAEEKDVFDHKGRFDAFVSTGLWQPLIRLEGTGIVKAWRPQGEIVRTALDVVKELIAV